MTLWGHTPRVLGLIEYFDEFDVKFEGGIGWNHTACATLTIGQIGWDDEGAFTTDAHALNTFIPTFDDHALTQEEFDGGVAIKTGIELFAGFFIFIKPASVVNTHLIFSLGDFALTNVDV